MKMKIDINELKKMTNINIEPIKTYKAIDIEIKESNKMKKRGLKKLYNPNI